MVRVTESALTLLRELKAQHQDPGQVLRIVPAGGGNGYKMLLGRPEDGDQPLEDQGLALAHLSRDAAAAMESATLVSQRTHEGLRLAANTPQPYPFGPMSELVAPPE